jgi:thioredoxin 1
MTITNDNFGALIATGKPVVIDFWATWCGPCQKMGPLIEALAEDYDGKAIVGKCNVDEEDELAMQFGVRSIPTVVFLKDGEVRDMQVGLCPKSVLEEKLNKLL